MNIVICGVGNIGLETLKLVAPDNNVLVIDQWPGSYLQEFVDSHSRVKLIKADTTSLPEMEAVVAGQLPD